MPQDAPSLPFVNGEPITDDMKARGGRRFWRRYLDRHWPDPNLPPRPDAPEDAAKAANAHYLATGDRSQLDRLGL